MKALTVIQPWASAIAVGTKRIETRSWATKYRGPLLIHAGKSTAYLPKLYKRGAITRRHDLKVIGKQVIEIACLPWPNYVTIREREAIYSLGALIAVAELTACHRIYEFWVAGNLFYESDYPGPNRSTFRLTNQELALGDFSPGRYGWVLANVRRLPEPIPWRGQQGLFNVPVELLGEYKHLLEIA